MGLGTRARPETGQGAVEPERNKVMASRSISIHVMQEWMDKNGYTTFLAGLSLPSQWQDGCVVDDVIKIHFLRRPFVRMHNNTSLSLESFIILMNICSTARSDLICDGYASATKR